MTLRALILAATVATLPAIAVAQTGGHAGHSMPMARSSSRDTAATQGYRAANAQMHEAMDIRFTNDADADFVRSMIPHHQGAIDMAKVALQHAQDEQVRQWATDVIRAQEREIAEMQGWLAKRGIR
jgi:uncharacterized protein (DUF305 family)